MHKIASKVNISNEIYFGMRLLENFFSKNVQFCVNSNFFLDNTMLLPNHGPIGILSLFLSYSPQKTK